MRDREKIEDWRVKFGRKCDEIGLRNPKQALEITSFISELLSSRDTDWQTAIEYNLEPEEIERVLGAAKALLHPTKKVYEEI